MSALFCTFLVSSVFSEYNGARQKLVVDCSAFLFSSLVFVASLKSAFVDQNAALASQYSVLLLD